VFIITLKVGCELTFVSFLPIVAIINPGLKLRQGEKALIPIDVQHPVEDVKQCVSAYYPEIETLSDEFN